MKRWKNVMLSVAALFFFACGAVASYELAYCVTGRGIDVSDLQSGIVIVYVSVVWLLIGYVAAHLERGLSSALDSPNKLNQCPEFLKTADNLPQAKYAGYVRYGFEQRGASYGSQNIEPKAVRDVNFVRCPRDGSEKELAPAEVDGD